MNSQSANGSDKPIYRWAGFIDGVPDLGTLYASKAAAKVFYDDVRRVEVRLAGKVFGLPGRQPT